MANDWTGLMTPIEQAMNWERMSGERLSDAERQRIMDGGEFIPPHMRPSTADVIDRPTTAINRMRNAISTAIAEAQEHLGTCDRDGDPCGADCACWRLVQAEIEKRRDDSNYAET